MRIVIDFPRRPETPEQAQAVALLASESCLRLLPIMHSKIGGLPQELHTLTWSMADLNVTVTNKEPSVAPD